MMKKNVIVYGLGRKMMYERNYLKDKYNIVAYCDSDFKKKDIASKWGEFIEPKDIEKYEYDNIIITSNYYTEIKKRLIKEFKINEEKIVADDDILLDELKNKRAMSVKHLDKSFYVIQRYHKFAAGLFSNYIFVLNGIIKALEKGCYPVVDFKYFMNGYLEPEKFFKENSWEYYFKQPCEFSVDEAYESTNVVFGIYDNYAQELLEMKEKIVKDKEARKFYKKICRKYIEINEECENLIAKEYKKLFAGKGKICGVLYRGTDYKNLQPYNHPKQPSLEEIISKTEELMKTWNYDYVYLATEDEEGIKAFKSRFGEKVIFTNQKRFGQTSKKYLHEISFDRENDRYLRGVEYLIVIALLARCNSLIAGQNNGLAAALLLNDKYEHEYIFELGRYGID